MLGMPRIGGDIFSPKAISGLKLWLRGDLGVTGASPVTAWADQSGNGNDANVAVGAPTLFASGINFKPSIRFQTGQGLKRTASSLLTTNSPRTIFFVIGGAAVGGAVANTVISFRLAGSGMEFLAGGYGLNFVYAGYTGPNATATGITSGVDSIFRITYTGSGLLSGMTMKQNATSLVLSGVGTVESDAGTAGYAICAGAIDDMTDGRIYEVLVYDSVLSADNQTAVNNYLKARYAL